MDLRVEFDLLGPVEYAKNYFDLHRKFTTLFRRNVDLLSVPVIKNPYFRRSIEETQEQLYAA